MTPFDAPDVDAACKAWFNGHLAHVAAQEPIAPLCWRCKRPMVQGKLGSWMCDCSSTPFDCRAAEPIAPPKKSGIQEHHIICEQHGETCGVAEHLFEEAMKYEAQLETCAEPIAPEPSSETQLRVRLTKIMFDYGHVGVEREIGKCDAPGSCIACAIGAALGGGKSE